MKKEYSYIGIDIGGTRIKIALIDPQGNIFYRKHLDTIENLKPDILIENLASIVNKIKDSFPDKNIFGIGIGCAGIIDHDKGIIKFSANIGWKKFNIGERLSNKVNFPVVVDNDATAAAWGIYYLSYHGKYDHFMCITLGTGIGGGLVLEGELYRGASSSAGEVGHMTLIPDGLDCSCGNKGCLERYAGIRGIIERTQEYLLDEKESIIMDFVQDGAITPKAIAQAAEKRDKVALRVWREVGEMIGTSLASVVNLLNVEVIHVIGGVSQAQKWIEKPIIDNINKRAFSTPAQSVKVIFGKRRKDMGVLGAGLLVLEKYHFKDYKSYNVCKAK
ncbi:ROK family protein [bacterium]